MENSERMFQQALYNEYKTTEEGLVTTFFLTRGHTLKELDSLSTEDYLVYKMAMQHFLELERDRWSNLNG